MLPPAGHCPADGPIMAEQSSPAGLKRAGRTLVVLSLALAGCQGRIVPTSPTPTLATIRLLSESNTSPVLRDLAASYHPANMLIAWEFDDGDWDTVSGWLREGRATFAMTDYLPPDSGLWATPIGQDGLAIVVNAANPIATLSADQLRSIFSGRVSNWRELGSTDMAIVPVVRPGSSSASQLFRAVTLGDRQITGAARLAFSNETMLQIIQNEPGAIGYVSLSALTAAGTLGLSSVNKNNTSAANNTNMNMNAVRAVALDQVLPTRQSITDGSYPLRSTVVLCGSQAPGSDVYRAFFAWLQSADGQTVVARYYAPLPAQS